MFSSVLLSSEVHQRQRRRVCGFVSSEAANCMSNPECVLIGAISRGKRAYNYNPTLTISEDMILTNPHTFRTYSRTAPLYTRFARYLQYDERRDPASNCKPTFRSHLNLRLNRKTVSTIVVRTQEGPEPHRRHSAQDTGTLPGLRLTLAGCSPLNSTSLPFESALVIVTRR